MPWGHVFKQLAAYAENQLDAAERERVERHLSTCDECRASLHEVRDGISWATQLRAEPMPADVTERIRSSVAASPRTSDPRRPRSVFWPAAAAAALVVVMVGFYWQVNRPWVQLHAASAEPTAFEREGRMLHERLASGEMSMTFKSSDEQALWQWLAAEHAPVTSMVISRPLEQRSQFAALGAAVQQLDGARASVLAYRIDGRPVTLVLAASDDVRNAPAAGWWSKRVLHRQEPDGTNTLTWTVGGGTYVMVSELDGAGQKACLICHSSPRFSDAIMRLSKIGPLDRQ